MVMVRYRRRFDILADIMRVAGKGAGKTRILYFAILSYLLLEKYLGVTVGAGFLRLGEDGYSVTKKGEEFLDSYLQFRDESSRVEQGIEGLKHMQVELERMCKGSGSDCRGGRRLRNGRRRSVQVVL